MAKVLSNLIQTLWTAYCRLMVRSQSLSSGAPSYDRLIRRMAKLEQTLASTPAQSLDDLVIKLDLLAGILFPPADPGAGDDSRSASNSANPLGHAHTIPSDTIEGHLFGQILTDACRLASGPAEGGLEEPAK